MNTSPKLYVGGLNGMVRHTNLNGPGDNYKPENSHVQPGLIRRFHETKMGGPARSFDFGTGKPKSEFLNLDNMAAASAHVMNLSHALYT